jgi:hypothetical protein
MAPEQTPSLAMVKDHGLEGMVSLHHDPRNTDTRADPLGKAAR